MASKTGHLWYNVTKKDIYSSKVQCYPMRFSKCLICINMNSELSDFWRNADNYKTDGEEIEVFIGRGSTPFNIIVDECVLTLAGGVSCDIQIKADGEKFYSRQSQHSEENGNSGANNDRKISTDGSILKKARAETTRLDEPQLIPIKIKLIEILEQGKVIYEMTQKEKFQIAKDMKSIGVSLFKDFHQLSFMCFSLALKYVICVGTDISDELKSDIELLKCQCYLNLSACQLQENAYHHVVQNCSKALQLNPDNVKGLCRKSQALVKLERYDEALSTVKLALDSEPNNKLLQNLLNTSQNKVKQQEEKLASAMNKMFN